MSELKHTPTCPHCDYEFDAEETWYSRYSENSVHTGDGDESELRCPNLDCNKKFKVVCEHVVMFGVADDD